MASSKGISVKGTSKDDVIIGTEKDDRLSGARGNDLVLGLSGRDRLKGGPGSDVLDGGRGDDDVRGEGGNDTLVYVMANNLHDHDRYDGGSGIDTLRLAFTRAEWLRADVQNDIGAYLKFLLDSIGRHGEAGGRTFHFRAFDLDASHLEKLEVLVDGRALDPRDEAVRAVADAATVSEDGTVSGNVLANDSVPDLVRSLQLVTGPARGALTLAADGAYTYTPGAFFNALRAGQTATETFTYRVTDADGDTATATATITIVGANDRPIAVNDVGHATEAGGTRNGTPGSAATGNVLANDTDPDAGDTRTVTTTGTFALAHGSLTLAANGAFTYAPRENDAAVQRLRTAADTLSDTFTYSIRDAAGITASAVLTLVVHGANDAPTALDDSAFAFSGIPVTVRVLANDVDPEGDVLSIAAVTSAGHGSVVINPGGTITYMPAAGFRGSDSFDYVVRDSGGLTDVGTVSLVVGLADHDRVGSDVFLQGNYMEIGVSSAGSLGTASGAPANYHPMFAGSRQISYVADLDGWDVGAVPPAGDFTLPGTPVDTLVFAASGANLVQDQRSGLQQIATTTADVSSGSLLSARTTGVGSNGLRITQTIELDPGSTFYKTIVNVENTAAVALTDVRFMRSFDPDQDIFRFGSFFTRNDVLANPGGGSDVAVSQALGISSGVSVNLIAFDSTARASNFGFSNYNAYDPRAWETPQDRNGASVDEAITLAFRFGNLAPGQRATAEFYTSINGRGPANDLSVGTPGNDTINAGAGNDLLLGLAGNDVLNGGSGNDTFIVGRGAGADTVGDFSAGLGLADVIQIRGTALHSFIDVTAAATQVGADTLINFGGADSVRLLQTRIADLHPDDFAFF